MAFFQYHTGPSIKDLSYTHFSYQAHIGMSTDVSQGRVESQYFF
jgi:hypothetical protein